MVNIGDKFIEKMPPFVGNGHEVFSWQYIVEDIVERDFWVAVKCKRLFKDGTHEQLYIDLELLKDEAFYKKIA